jgi:probable F420-dependent oxidoreductase
VSDVRIGVQVRPQHADYDAMRRAWLEAEQLGVDAVFTWDHFYPLSGDPDGKHMECLTLLAAMAEATERVPIGALVMCNSYRNPQYAATALGTIDQISGGRLILGIGSGWFQRDYDEYGYEFGTAGSRLRQLARDLPILKERLTKLNPPPIGDMPILIGGRGERVTLRLVAEHADSWHAFGDIETFRHKDAVLRRHCADVGRDPDEIERAWGLGDGGVEHAARLHEAGVDHLIVSVDGDGRGYDLSRLPALLEWRDRTRG